VDQEIRPALLSNIVIVGAASQQKGLVKRFDNEIKALFPGPNVRLHTGSTTGERSFAGWIGGSILASLGSFHQVGFHVCALRADEGSCGFRGRSTASMGRAS
jgi:actin-related protein 4